MGYLDRVERMTLQRASTIAKAAARTAKKVVVKKAKPRAASTNDMMAIPAAIEPVGTLSTNFAPMAPLTPGASESTQSSLPSIYMDPLWLGSVTASPTTGDDGGSSTVAGDDEAPTITQDDVAAFYDGRLPDWAENLDYEDPDVQAQLNTALHGDPNSSIRARADLEGPAARAQFETGEAYSHLEAARLAEKEHEAAVDAATPVRELPGLISYVDDSGSVLETTLLGETVYSTHNADMANVAQRFQTAVVEEGFVLAEEALGRPLTGAEKTQLISDPAAAGELMENVTRHHDEREGDDEFQTGVVTSVITERAKMQADSVADLPHDWENNQGLSPQAAAYGTLSIQIDLDHLGSFGISDPDGTISSSISEDPVIRQYLQTAAKFENSDGSGPYDENGNIVLNGCAVYTIERGDTATAIAEQFGMNSNEFLTAYPTMNLDEINEGDVVAIPTEDRLQVYRTIEGMIGDADSLDDLPEGDQAAIRILLQNDYEAAAADAGLNGTLLPYNIHQRKGDFFNYLPRDVEGLDNIIISMSDTVLTATGYEMESRRASAQAVRDILGGRSFGDLFDDEQAAVRQLLLGDFSGGAVGLGLDTEALDGALDRHGRDLRNYLPPAADSIIRQEQNAMRSMVEQYMGPLRDDINACLDGDDQACTDARNEAIVQMDAAIAAEGDIETEDPEAGIFRRNEEQVIGGYIGIMEELIPSQSWDDISPEFDAAADEILVQRPADDFRAASFFDKPDVLEEITSTGSDGLPMSPGRANDIIMAVDGELEDWFAETSSRESWQLSDWVESFGRIAANASSHEPGIENPGVQLIAQAMIDNGLQGGDGSQPLLDNARRDNVRKNWLWLGDNVRENGLVDLNIAIASELEARGETDNAEIVLNDAVADLQTYYENAAEHGDTFKEIFQNDAAVTYFSIAPFLTEEQRNEYLSAMMEDLKTDDRSGIENWLLNKDDPEGVYRTFFDNQQGLYSSMMAIEAIPENLQGLNGGQALMDFHQDTMASLNVDPDVDVIPTDDSNPHALQFAFLGREFSTEPSTPWAFDPDNPANSRPQEALMASIAGKPEAQSPLTPDQQDLLTSLDDVFYPGLIEEFDAAQELAQNGSSALAIPPEELTAFRESLGSDPEAAAEALRDNPEAVLAFAQYASAAELLDVQEMAEGEHNPAHGPLGFAIRTINIFQRDMLGPYLDKRPVFKATGGRMQHPVFGPAQHLFSSAMAFEGMYSFWPIGPDGEGFPTMDGWTTTMNPFYEDFSLTDKEFALGYWSAFLGSLGVEHGVHGAASATNGIYNAMGRTAPAWIQNTAAGNTIAQYLYKNTVIKGMPPVGFALLFAADYKKGDTAKLPFWAAGFLGTTLPRFAAVKAAVPWFGPVGWVIAGVGNYALSTYRYEQAGARMEGPMIEGLVAAGMPRDKAEKLSNATEEGQWTYPLLAEAGEQYLDMGPEEMGNAFMNENVTAYDLNVVMRTTHQLQNWWDEDIPDIADLGGDERTAMAVIYYSLNGNSLDGLESTPLFAGGEMPSKEDIVDFIPQFVWEQHQLGRWTPSFGQLWG